jgi:hypothetical protein
MKMAFLTCLVIVSSMLSIITAGGLNKFLNFTSAVTVRPTEDCMLSKSSVVRNVLSMKTNDDTVLHPRMTAYLRSAADDGGFVASNLQSPTFVSWS